MIKEIFILSIIVFIVSGCGQAKKKQTATKINSVDSLVNNIEKLSDKEPDVYVAGFEQVQDLHIAKLWKNGVAQNLTNGVSEAKAFSVFVK